MNYLYPLKLLVILFFASAANAQTNIDDYLRLEENNFILYAPNHTELERGKEKLTYAAQKFSNYFGRSSVRISVLLTESPSEIQNLDLSKIRTESSYFLPFITESFLNNQSRNAARVFALNMGAVLLEKNDKVEVAAVIPQANEQNIDIQTSDNILAINGQELTSLREFEEIYSAVKVDKKIKIQLDRDGNTREVIFKKQDSDKAPVIQSVKAPEKQAGESDRKEQNLSTRRPLTHEACHGYFIAYVDKKYPNLAQPKEGNVYGSEKMPDWLDEAVATLCEIPELQAARTDFLINNLDARYSLEKLFSMAHPLETLNINASKKQRSMKVLKLKSGENITQKLGMFYSQVQSISNFLIEKTHPNIIRNITQHIAQEQGDMATFLKSHPDLPNTVVLLEEEWLEWVANHGG